MASFTWVIVAVLYMFMDLAYFIRGALTGIACKTLLAIGMGKKSLLDEVHTYGICLTTDMDFQWHMNNARYLRECDFGRIEMWMRNGAFDTITKLGGGITLGGSTIRYRKSLQLFDMYIVKTKILCWDEKSFYIEQQIVRTLDNFVCAIVVARQALTRLSPNDVVQQLMGKDVKSPEFPEEVKAWIQYNQLSSDKLKKAA